MRMQQKLKKTITNNLAISHFLEGLERDLQSVKRKGLKLVSPHFHCVSVAHWKLDHDKTCLSYEAMRRVPRILKNLKS